MSRIIGNPLNLDTRPAEIDQQTESFPGRPQVIDALRAMRAVERPHGFQFDQDGVFDRKIDEILAHQDALLCNLDSALLLNCESGKAQLHREGVFMDFFQKSVAEGIRYREGAADDPVRYRVQLRPIRVHLRGIRVHSAFPTPYR